MAAHLLDMCLLIGWIYEGSFVGYVGHGFVYWQDIWWLIGWKCVGSLVGDVFALWLEM